MPSVQICLRRPALSFLILFAVLAALALAACDDDGDGDLGPDPATVAPPEAPIYGEVVVGPGGDQRDDLLAALSKITNNDDPAGLIRSAVDSSFSEQGIDFEEDIEPWLGQRVGGFLTEISAEGAEGALALAVTDEGAALEAVQKAADADPATETDAAYQGVDYQVDEDGNAVGIVGDFLVGGTEGGLKAAIDAAAGDSLADDGEAAGALGDAPSDSIFRAYLDTARLVDLAVEEGLITQQDLDAAIGDQAEALQEGPVVLSGGATADSMFLEVAGPSGGQADSGSIVSELPADSWLAIGVPMIGDAISAGYASFLQSFEAGLEGVEKQGLKGVPEGIPGAELPEGLPEGLPDIEAEIRRATGLDLSEDFDWAGDLGLFVEGSSLLSIGGGLVIDTDDEQAAAATLAKLRRALGRQRDLRIVETPDGFQVQTLGAPLGAEVAIRDGRVVLAVAGTSVGDVLSPAGTLSDSENFQAASEALGEGLEAALYIDFPAIVSLIESSGLATGDPSYEEAKPILDAIAYLVAGGGSDGDRASGRLVLGLRDGGSDSGAAAAIVP
jgi:hypothetical protein